MIASRIKKNCRWNRVLVSLRMQFYFLFKLSSQFHLVRIEVLRYGYISAYFLFCVIFSFIFLFFYCDFTLGLFKISSWSWNGCFFYHGLNDQRRYFKNIHYTLMNCNILLTWNHLMVHLFVCLCFSSILSISLTS